MFRLTWKPFLLLMAASVALAEKGHWTSGLARQSAADTLTDYVLEGETKSGMFSECVALSNTLKGSLYSMQSTEGGMKYALKNVTTERSINWTTVADMTSDLQCYMAANEQNALMFTYNTSAGCKVASDVYSPFEFSLEGKEVYIVDPLPSDRCFLPKVILAEGEMTDDAECSATCSDGGLTFEGEELEAPDPINCCAEGTSPCLYIDGAARSVFCPAVHYCKKIGLQLAEVNTQEKVDAVMTLLAGTPESETKFFVNVRWMDGEWKHFPSKTSVDSTAWEDPANVPAEGSCIVINKEGKLMGGSCSEPLCYPCQEMGSSLEAC